MKNPVRRPRRQSESLLKAYDIAVVIPSYNVEREIEGVLRGVPSYCRYIIVVDDASTDRTAEIAARVAGNDPRIMVISHQRNKGVGGAMVSGFRRALDLDAQIVVKLDGDGQMSPEDLPRLLLPLIRGEADYTKGNRFRDFRSLRRMPPIRRFGNMSLSFLTKASTGYWNCFDPTNGFIGIRAEVLEQLPLEKIHESYYFETSMLSRLYLIGAVVRDVAMPARYGDEKSNLSIRRVLGEFPPKLVGSFLRRMVIKNFINDFSMETVFLVCGMPMLLTGVIYGAYNWVRYAMLGVGAPTGTVVISALLIILGFQILLAAVSIDLQSVPREPLCNEPLRARDQFEEQNLVADAQSVKGL